MSPLLVAPFTWFYTEFGLRSVYATGLDAWFIILARSSRMFAYGATSLIFAVFFSSLGFSDVQIGLFMTLTLAGDVLLSLLLTLVADRIGRRRVLFAGAGLMIFSGTVLATSENFILLLAAAVIGVLSATGSDFGPFRAIEESTIAQLTTAATRSDVLSWYVTTSSAGSAAGVLFSGRMVDFMLARGWGAKSAYHAMFYLYVVMGVVGLGITASLSEGCELASLEDSKIESVAGPAEGESAETLLDEDRRRKSDPDVEASTPSSPPEKQSLLAQISRPTRKIMYTLWALLIVDSLADGMTSLSLTYYYMDLKLSLPKTTLGDLSSTSYLLASLGTIFASPLSRRLGLVNTMVFTHLPSSLAVLLFPVPRGVLMTIVLFYIRTGLNNMDQAPRSAFIAAVVRPEERTAVMGITSMLRTLASTLGPSVTGWLAGGGRFWIAFVVAGLLRVAYDLGLWALFVGMKIEDTPGTDVGVVEPRADAGGDEEVELDELCKAQWTKAPVG